MNRHQRRAIIAKERISHANHYQKVISKMSMFDIIANFPPEGPTEADIAFHEALEDLFTIEWIVKWWLVMYGKSVMSTTCMLQDLDVMIRKREDKTAYWPELYEQMCYLLCGYQTVDAFLVSMVKMTLIYRDHWPYGKFNCGRLIETLGRKLHIDLRPIFDKKIKNLQPESHDYYLSASYFQEYQHCYSLKNVREAYAKYQKESERRIQRCLDDEC